VPEASRPGADARTDIRCIHNSVDLSSRAAWVAWSAHLSVSAVTGRCVLVRTAAAACLRACANAIDHLADRYLVSFLPTRPLDSIRAVMIVCGLRGKLIGSSARCFVVYNSQLCTKLKT